MNDIWHVENEHDRILLRYCQVISLDGSLSLLAYHQCVVPVCLCACICIVCACVYLVLQQCTCEGGSLVSPSIAQQLPHSVTLGIVEWCPAVAGGLIHIRFGRE